VISAIGAGRIGGEIRKALRASPYGWPQDAIDAALIALHRSQHITATSNGVAVALGQLDQNKIAKAEFRVEHATLSVQDRLLLRKLLTQLVQCKSGEEGAKAPEFLTALVNLARAAGGDAPLPLQPATTDIEDMQRLAGNEQLVAIKDKAADLEARIKAWTAARDLAAKRLPSWAVVEHLARHAGDLPGMQSHLDQIEAIRTHRLLLEPTDSVAPIRVAVAGLLREAVNGAHAEHAAAYNQALAALAGNENWTMLDPTQQTVILGSVGSIAPAKPDVSSDEALGRHLDARTLKVALAERDAIPGRVQQAIERAARLLEPKVLAVAVERVTLRTPEDVEAWLGRQKGTLLAALADGPVLIQ